MIDAMEFLLRLLDHGPAMHVAWEDFQGEYGDMLRACQAAGFLAGSPSLHPVPSCPHCGEGVPYPLEGRHVCNCCRGDIADHHLHCWGLDAVAFLGWLASRLGLRGTVCRVEDRLWHLGTCGEGDELHECFYRLAGELSEGGEARLGAYRNVLVLHGLSCLRGAGRLGVRCVSVLKVLRWEGDFRVTNLLTFLRSGSHVGFDPRSGTLRVGDRTLGEVPVGSRECAFLDCLARRLDEFVPYADLKREVLRRTGSGDSRDEATFCHRLKSRIKKEFIPEIDRLLVTTNKGDGYRLRRHVALPVSGNGHE